MSSPLAALGAGCLTLAVFAAGCAHPAVAPRSPLRATRMSPDSVVLELVFVRFAEGRADLNDDLWAQIDEQKLPPAVRRELDQQGLRVGVLAGTLPSALNDELARQAPEPIAGGAGVPLAETAGQVTVRHVQARRGKRIEVVAGGPYPRLPVLELAADGQIEGRDYLDAECRFSLRAWPREDATVRLELVPEIQHGAARPRLAAHPEMGMVYFEPGRDRKVFSRLTCDLGLAPGEILVLGTRPHDSGHLGQHFFTVDDPASGGRLQKLLLVRLAQTQHDATFTPEELLDEGLVEAEDLAHGDDAAGRGSEDDQGLVSGDPAADEDVEASGDDR